MTYPKLEQFVAPAKARSEVWRTVLGTLGIAVLYVGLLQIGLYALAMAFPGIAFMQIVTEMASGSTPRGMAALFLTFVPMVLGVGFVTRRLHTRPLRSLLGTGAATQFRRAVLPLLALAFLVFPIGLTDEQVAHSTGLGTVLAWLPLAMPLLLLQVGAEELVFRGYLLQQLGARSQNPLLWMVLPSALFGALHYSSADFGPNAIWLTIWATIFGCFAADLTARSGSLGPALALHFATNFSGMVLIGQYGNLDGLALYTLVIDVTDFSMLAPYLALDFVAMGVSWLLIRLVMRL